MFGLVPVKKQAATSAPEVAAASSELATRHDGGYQVQGYRGRPRVNRSMFRCAKCNREPREFAHYAAETGQVSSGRKMTEEEAKACGFPVLDCGEGYIHGYIRCHDESAEIYAPFADVWKAVDLGTKIIVFDEQAALNGPLALPDSEGRTIDLPAAEVGDQHLKLTSGLEEGQ